VCKSQCQLDGFCTQEGGLLAMWVTNRERLRRFVDQELLPKWGLEQVATWFWLKVTNSGQLVSPLVLPVPFR
jgi:N6-adenosine-specific RNA methylase IME4